MVKKILKNNSKYYQCNECKFIYKYKKIAEKCQKWCKEHHSCNLEIIKYTIDMNLTKKAE